MSNQEQLQPIPEEQAAREYAERTANGIYPLDITRERDVKVGTADFLAGVKWEKERHLSQKKEPVLPRWVKASERLPPLTGSPEYHFRIDGFHKVNGNFHRTECDERGEGDIVFTVHGGLVFDDYLIPQHRFHNLEWLEESIPASVPEEDEKDNNLK